MAISRQTKERIRLNRERRVEQFAVKRYLAAAEHERDSLVRQRIGGVVVDIYTKPCVYGVVNSWLFLTFSDYAQSMKERFNWTIVKHAVHRPELKGVRYVKQSSQGTHQA